MQKLNHQTIVDIIAIFQGSHAPTGHDSPCMMHMCRKIMKSTFHSNKWLGGVFLV
jgi:hypothetical protein